MILTMFVRVRSQADRTVLHYVVHSAWHQVYNISRCSIPPHLTLLFRSVVTNSGGVTGSSTRGVAAATSDDTSNILITMEAFGRFLRYFFSKNL